MPFIAALLLTIFLTVWLGFGGMAAVVAVLTIILMFSAF